MIVRLPFTNGNRAEVTAIKVGAFAVHRSIRYYLDGPRKELGWSVTEPVTGLAAGRHFPTHKAAIAVARALSAFPVDWSHLRLNKKGHAILPVKAKALAKRIVVEAKGY